MKRSARVGIATVVAAVCGVLTVLDHAAGITPVAPGDESYRVLRKEIVVPGTVEQVFELWTTTEGVKKFFTQQGNVELKVGGKFDILFDGKADKSGKRGAEGARILSYIPNEMLAFDWGFPPSVPTLRESGAKTQVVLQFEAVDKGHVRIKFAQHGWGEGKDWNEGYAYFDKAWGWVLDQCAAHLKKTVKKSKTKSPKVKSWEDKHVKVSSIGGAGKYQEFEMDIPLPVKAVWDILATEAGFKKLGGKDPVVELKPGGAYSFWPGATNKVLAFVPNEMLSTSGSAPPQFPNVRKGGTWSAYFFEPAAGGKSTKLRLVVVGWRPGEKEWDDAFDYFLKNNPIFLNSVYAALTKKSASASAGEVLRHEGVIDAPVEKVWAAFTTKEGIESWMVPHAEIDLRVGGKMLTHYDPNGKLGDENTIENTILSFEPNRMLSIKATKAPANFPFKKAIEGMWSVIHFEPLAESRTRIVTVGMGYADDEESKKMRAFFDQGNAWTIKKLEETFGKKAQGKPAEAVKQRDDVYRTAADDATKDSKLASLARLIGTWESKSQEADGGLFHSKVVYEWGLGKKLIKCKSYVIKEGEEHLVYESFFAWHPGKKQIIGECFSSWDSMYDGVFDVAGDVVKYTWKAYAADQMVDFYQTMKFEGDDAYHWTVFTKEGEDWVQSKESTFHRIGGDGAPARAALDANSQTPTAANTSVAAENGLGFGSYLAHIAAAGACLALNEAADARRWVEQAPEKYRNWEWRYLNASLDHSIQTFADHPETVISVAFSPDGRLIAEALTDGTAIIRDAGSGKVLHTLSSKEKSLWHVSFSADGKRLAVSGASGTVRIWDVETGKEVRALKHEKSQAYSAAFSPDGRQIATSMLGYVKLWDAQSGDEVRTLEGHVNRPPVTRVVYSSDGKTLASASWDNNVIIWNAATGEVLHKLGPGYGGAEYTAYNAVAFSPDGKRVAAETSSGTCWLWDANSGEVIRKWPAHAKTGYGLAFSHDGKRLATSSIDQSISIWDAESGKQLTSLRGHGDAVWSVAFSPDDALLVSGSADRSMKLWNVGAQVPVLAVWSDKGVWATEFSPDGRLIATGSSDLSVKVWDAQTGKIVADFPNLPEQVAGIAFSPDSKQLAATTNKPAVHILDIGSKKVVRELEGHKGGSPDVAWSADGRRIVSTSYDKTIRIWDASTGESLHTLDGKGHFAYAVAISPDSKWFASADGDSRIRIRDLQTGETKSELTGIESKPLCVAISRDGRLVASAGYDTAVHVWEVESGKLIDKMPGHGSEVFGVAFTPDGSRLASASYDQTVRMWDVAAGVQAATLIRADKGAYALSFSPDGSRLATSFTDGEVRVLETVPFAERVGGSRYASLNSNNKALRAMDGDKP